MSKTPTGFPWSEQELHREVTKAIKSLWGVRDSQAAKQKATGKKLDAGNRATATGGQHLNALSDLLRKVAEAAGFSRDEIRTRTGIEVAGFYRPNKKWDLVVVRGDRLCAAVELKSMAGSYGNNLNNRTEEALGSATDIWAAYRKGTLGIHSPWLGYLFVIRDEPKSQSPVRLKASIPAVDPAFLDTSYVQRYELLCKRMMLERVYQSAVYITSPKAKTGSYVEPSPDLGFAQFARSLYGHLTGCI